LGTLYPRLLRRRIACPYELAFYGDRLLALLGCASLGRRLSRAVHDDYGRLYVRAPRYCERASGTQSHLSGHHSLFNGRRCRVHASRLFFRRTRDSHGYGVVLLCCRGNPPDLPYSRIVEFSPAWNSTTLSLSHVVPSPLGRHVPGCGWILELFGSGHLRLPY